MSKTDTTNKYFNNEVCDRLCEGAMLADKKGMDLRLDGLGVVIENGDHTLRVGYLEISEARINPITAAIEMMKP